MYQLPFKTRIQQTPLKGLGVFAVNHIKQGEIIERCPVLIVSKANRQNLYEQHGILRNYTFQWAEDIAITWGYGSLYNHSSRPNAIYYRDLQSNTMIFQSLIDISPGEEICTSYGNDSYFETKNYKIIDERKYGN